MDVTNGNFAKALQTLKDHLPRAEFISFDLEFTGLGEHRPSQLDTPQIRYSSAREDASEFPPIQFGLCLFRKSTALVPREDSDAFESEESWETISYNFNLFPRAVYYPPCSRYPLYDKRFSLQASTVSFLTSHMFDFQKCFKVGITWLREDREKDFLEHVQNDMRVRRKNRWSMDNLSGEDGMLLKEWGQNIDKWLTELKEKGNLPLQSDTEAKIRSFVLPNDARLRSLIFDFVRLNYQRMAAHAIPAQNGKKMIRLSLFGSEDRAKQQYEKVLLQDVKDVVLREVMFRQVVDELRKHKKPIVVHNGLMDVTKLYANFVGDLPAELTSFKKVFRKEFPVVFDTKRLVDNLCAKDEEVRREMRKARGVSEMLGVLRKVAENRKHNVVMQTFIPVDSNDRNVTGNNTELVARLTGFSTTEIDDAVMERDENGFGRYSVQGYVHEAGYDALETGMLFAFLSTLGKQSPNELSLSSCGGFSRINVYSDMEESNPWFELPVFIIKGIVKDDGGIGEHRKEHGKARFNHTVKQLTKDTIYCGDQTEIVTAGKEVCMAILRVKPSRKRKRGEEGNVGESEDRQSEGAVDHTSMIIENGRKLGVEVIRYAPSALERDWAFISRARVFA
ncbi:Poly(A)-specific ribonuclease PARN [Gracilariopsis chorda]|uniref:Poly(A)-specific ribonuclease PARN n=1 Tax=Gracilariopsis chorda TaxID=448386 RepID=A0A2V3IWX2_9FLOR|nr:Poly(A)-specific ribonuclease PARN [Gracilariopsis chorda]|eukprot:PXF46648.1 Poly(A)-specific ribonuclease PARN [Gracilariopsis chorda]